MHFSDGRFCDIFVKGLRGLAVYFGIGRVIIVSHLSYSAAIPVTQNILNFNLTRPVSRRQCCRKIAANAAVCFRDVIHHKHPTKKPLQLESLFGIERKVCCWKFYVTKNDSF